VTAAELRAVIATEPEFERRFAAEIRLDCEESIREFAHPA
jgi:hypothetical protein